MLQLTNLQHFFAMGGYATYVWSAYGVAAIIFIANLIIPLKKQRELRKKLSAVAESK